ncbi:zinc finger protein 878-like isoform X5 [Anopheles aquasalis]|uniref:zinc finger protein 878-like isoform X5 n=1 Tax=Anopheles aquasalis TaxID=42839 RepID=UPI00215AFE33|nr:zinc finger protein 878-like isoform X5 [Anopheles aquasalis]
MEVLGEISNFCRFCLSQDYESLMPLSSAIEGFSFSVQDIQETTGISILESETVCLAVCSKCSTRIELAVDFRRSCIKGNVKFLQLFGHIINKLRSSDIAEEILENADDPLETALQIEYKNEKSSQAQNELELLVPQDLLEESLNTIQEECRDGNSSDEYIPPVATNMLRSKRKTSSTRMTLPTSYRRKEKSKERIEASKEVQVTKSRKHRKQLCGVCGALVYRLDDHIRSHTKENLLKCPHCPVQMVNRTNLLRHVRTVHEKVVIKSCEPCGRGFTTANAYKSHMRTHHNIGEQYQCEICLKIFNHASSRLLHKKRMHIAEFKFECQICQQKFKDRSALKRHERVHSTNTPFACSQCPKRFKSPSAKRTHEITHSGIEFPCTICTKVYRYKTLLKMHYRKCHPADCTDE